MITFSVKFIASIPSAYCNTILEDKVGLRCGCSVLSAVLLLRDQQRKSFFLILQTLEEYSSRHLAED